MSDKSLSTKAIDIKGSDYVLVKDRIIYFNETYPNGSIQTELVSDPRADTIVIKSTVTPDHEKPERKFVDYGQELIGSSFINKTSAMENASTSATGRALAYMGIGVIDSVASVDEINKAKNRHNVDPELAKSKSDLQKLFAEKGYKDFEAIVDVISQAIGKERVDTVEEAKKVTEFIKETT